MLQTVWPSSGLTKIRLDLPSNFWPTLQIRVHTWKWFLFLNQNVLWILKRTVSIWDVLLSIQNIRFNWWIKNNHNITLKDFALKLDLWFDTLQGLAGTLKVIRTSKTDNLIKQWFSSIMSLFKMETSPKGKNLLPKGVNSFL